MGERRQGVEWFNLAEEEREGTSRCVSWNAKPGEGRDGGAEEGELGRRTWGGRGLSLRVGSRVKHNARKPPPPPENPSILPIF